jgi:hypothetical protein
MWTGRDLCNTGSSHKPLHSTSQSHDVGVEGLLKMVC